MTNLRGSRHIIYEKISDAEEISYCQLRNKTGYTEKTIVTAVRWLVDNGYLERYRPYSGVPFRYRRLR